MEKLSSLAEAMTGSEIVRLGNEINERKRKGEHIFNFTIGDFDPAVFPIPKELEELIVESYQKKYTNYPPAEGIPELREAVAGFIKEWEGLDYSTTEILIASGGRPLIYTLFKTLVDEGDKVIYTVPSWNNNHYTNLHKAKHCIIETTVENNFMPCAADIEKQIDGAALLCLCTPQNPTGTTISEQELANICNLVIAENKKRVGEKKLYVMFDQMYWMLTYKNFKHYNPVSINPAMKPYTIFIDGISKVFASTGVRVGWAFGPEQIITKMKAFLSHIGAWAPMAEQQATAAYILQTANVKQYLETFKEALEFRLYKVYDGLLNLKRMGYAIDVVTPQAGIYLTVMFNLSGMASGEKTLETQQDVTSFLINEARLAIVPFYAFGAGADSAWYRLSVGTLKKTGIQPFLQQLEAAVKKLK